MTYTSIINEVMIKEKTYVTVEIHRALDVQKAHVPNFRDRLQKLRREQPFRRANPPLTLLPDNRPVRIVARENPRMHRSRHPSPRVARSRRGTSKAKP